MTTAKSKPVEAIGGGKVEDLLGDRFKAAPSPWQPITNPIDIKHLGKLGEELSELGVAKDRISIQGLNGTNPTTGQANKIWFEDEIADVLAMIAHNIQHFNLDEDRIMVRMDAKMRYIAPWFKMP